jgi:hypothetical protein
MNKKQETVQMNLTPQEQEVIRRRREVSRFQARHSPERVRAGQAETRTSQATGQALGQAGTRTGQALGQAKARTGQALGQAKARTGQAAGQAKTRTGQALGQAAGQAGMRTGQAAGQAGMRTGQAGARADQPPTKAGEKWAAQKRAEGRQGSWRGEHSRRFSPLRQTKPGFYDYSAGKLSDYVQVKGSHPTDVPYRY